jgi:hypothetical protein
LQPIVGQISHYRDWLALFRIVPHSLRGYLGVVSWYDECKEIAGLLRSDDIPSAQKRVQRVLGTDEDDENNQQANFLSLKRAIARMEQFDPSFEKPLSIVAERFETDRLAKLSEFNTQLAQCVIVEKRIREINKKVANAWDAVQDTLDAAEKARFWQRTERIRSLKLAIENYLELCPKGQRILGLLEFHPVVAALRDSVINPVVGKPSILYEDLCSSH